MQLNIQIINLKIMMQVKMKKQKKKTTGILNIEEQALEQLDSHVNELKQKEVELTQELQVKKFE